MAPPQLEPATLYCERHPAPIVSHVIYVGTRPGAPRYVRFSHRSGTSAVARFVTVCDWVRWDGVRHRACIADHDTLAGCYIRDRVHVSPTFDVTFRVYGSMWVPPRDWVDGLPPFVEPGASYTLHRMRTVSNFEVSDADLQELIDGEALQG